MPKKKVSRKPPQKILWSIRPARKRAGKPPVLRSGEPRKIALGLWEGDHAFHGEELISCCDCGLDHFVTYELFTEKRSLVLQVRAYRLGKRGKYYG